MVLVYVRHKEGQEWTVFTVQQNATLGEVVDQIKSLAVEEQEMDDEQGNFKRNPSLRCIRWNNYKLLKLSDGIQEFVEDGVLSLEVEFEEKLCGTKRKKSDTDLATPSRSKKQFLQNDSSEQVNPAVNVEAATDVNKQRIQPQFVALSQILPATVAMQDAEDLQQEDSVVLNKSKVHEEDQQEVSEDEECASSGLIGKKRSLYRMQKSSSKSLKNLERQKSQRQVDAEVQDEKQKSVGRSFGVQEASVQSSKKRKKKNKNSQAQSRLTQSNDNEKSLKQKSQQQQQQQVAMSQVNSTFGGTSKLPAHPPETAVIPETQEVVEDVFSDQQNKANDSKLTKSSDMKRSKKKETSLLSLKKSQGSKLKNDSEKQISKSLNKKQASLGQEEVIEKQQNGQGQGQVQEQSLVVSKKQKSKSVVSAKNEKQFQMQGVLKEGLQVGEQERIQFQQKQMMESSNLNLNVNYLSNQQKSVNKSASKDSNLNDTGCQLVEQCVDQNQAKESTQIKSNFQQNQKHVDQIQMIKISWIETATLKESDVLVEKQKSVVQNPSLGAVVKEVKGGEEMKQTKKDEESQDGSTSSSSDESSSSSSSSDCKDDETVQECASQPHNEKNTQEKLGVNAAENKIADSQQNTQTQNINQSNVDNSVQNASIKNLGQKPKDIDNNTNGKVNEAAEQQLNSVQQDDIQLGDKNSSKQKVLKSTQEDDSSSEDDDSSDGDDSSSDEDDESKGGKTEYDNNQNQGEQNGNQKKELVQNQLQNDQQDLGTTPSEIKQMSVNGQVVDTRTASNISKQEKQGSKKSSDQQKEKSFQKEQSIQKQSVEANGTLDVQKPAASNISQKQRSKSESKLKKAKSNQQEYSVQQGGPSQGEKEVQQCMDSSIVQVGAKQLETDIARPTQSNVSQKEKSKSSKKSKRSGNQDQQEQSVQQGEQTKEGDNNNVGNEANIREPARSNISQSKSKKKSKQSSQDQQEQSVQQRDQVAVDKEVSQGKNNNNVEEEGNQAKKPQKKAVRQIYTYREKLDVLQLLEEKYDNNVQKCAQDFNFFPRLLYKWVKQQKYFQQHVQNAQNVQTNPPPTPTPTPNLKTSQKRKFSVKFKLEVLQKLESKFNNSVAKCSEEFKINQRLIRQWRKEKSKLQQVHALAEEGDEDLGTSEILSKISVSKKNKQNRLFTVNQKLEILQKLEEVYDDSIVDCANDFQVDIRQLKEWKEKKQQFQDMQEEFGHKYTLKQGSMQKLKTLEKNQEGGRNEVGVSQIRENKNGNGNGKVKLYTVNQKLEILQQLEEVYDGDVKKCSDDLQVGTSLLFRWRRQQNFLLEMSKEYGNYYQIPKAKNQQQQQGNDNDVSVLEVINQNNINFYTNKGFNSKARRYTVNQKLEILKILEKDYKGDIDVFSSKFDIDKRCLAKWKQNQNYLQENSKEYGNNFVITAKKQGSRNEQQIQQQQLSFDEDYDDDDDEN